MGSIYFYCFLSNRRLIQNTQKRLVRLLNGKSREAMILHRVREKDIEEREMARGRASGSAGTLGIFTLYILLHYVSGTRYFPV